LASAATAISAAAIAVVVVSSARSNSSGSENVPYSPYRRTAPISRATALTPVTSSAISAAPRASRRSRSKPIRKYDATAVRSKNTNSSTRSRAHASPTIAAMKSTIHGQKRRASVAGRPACRRWSGRYAAP
jgi:hypothetical protein